MAGANWDLIVIAVIGLLSLQFGFWVAGRRWRRDPDYQHRSSCLGDSLSLGIGLLWMAIGGWLLYVGGNTYLQERDKPPDSDPGIVDTDSSDPTPPAVQSLVTADVYASIYVYDASIGPEVPVPGAVTSLCDRPTDRDGWTRCPWMVGPISQEWWEALQDTPRTLTLRAEASGFKPSAVAVRATAAQEPEFSIGLWPLEVAQDPGEAAGADAQTPLPEVVASVYASIFVYDAAVGPEAPIMGATTSLCDSPTNRRGKASCPWLVGIVPADWWEENQSAMRPVTLTVEAAGFEPTTVLTEAAVTQAPRFTIGLWPEGSGAPASELSGETLIANGDFARGLEGWEVIQGEKCTQCSMEVQAGDSTRRHVLAWRRTQGHSDGASIWARQPIMRSVEGCEHLVLAFQVWVEVQSLANSGWWAEGRGGSGEYPAKVSITFLDAQEERFEWSHGFLYEHDGSTSLTNYTKIPQRTWYTFQVDLRAPDPWVDGRGAPLPEPSSVAEIHVGGSGWDLAGSIANLQFICQSPP